MPGECVRSMGGSIHDISLLLGSPTRAVSAQQEPLNGMRACYPFSHGCGFYPGHATARSIFPFAGVQVSMLDTPASYTLPETRTSHVQVSSHLNKMPSSASP